MSDARVADDWRDDETIDDPTEVDDPVDRVAEEFAERCRVGESPSISEYAARYPDHAGRLLGLLPTVAMMEQLKRDSNSAREAPTPAPIPGRLGEFRILRELGRGGMGVVYEAVQETLGRHVALKVVHHAQLDARRMERFRREAQAVAHLHHTNIVPIFAVGEHEGLPYFAMQYIRGSGLDAMLARWRGEKPAPGEGRARLVARLGIQAAEAIQYAHEQGVLHRDIKPANLLVDEQGAAWVTDFGLAKLAGLEDLTASGDVIGTLRYLAPEALRGETGPRSDVYSLGLTLYEAITLVPPYGDLNPGALLRRVSEGQLPRPRKLDPAIPRDLETVVLKAIAREPGHRYASAGALAEDLRRFLEDRPIRARRANVVERAWRWSRRNRLAAALVATAAAALLLAAIVGWIGYASTRKALAGESLRRLEAERATRRADENVALSLAVFAELFEKLSPKGEPFPPPPGRAQPKHASDPAGRAGPRRGEAPGGRRPPPPILGGNPFAADDRPADGPPGRGGPSNHVDLLQSVLTFYDRFARRNDTDPRLQGEAAWAYFKVGALYQRLGRDREAASAVERGGAMLDDLVTHFPRDPRYRVRLVEVAIMAEPWSADPESLAGLEDRLRRAREVIDGLAAEAPSDADHLQAQVHAHAKLGVVLQRRGRADEAEASYRRAIGLADAILGHAPDNARMRVDRADVREELAMLRLDRGGRDEALSLLIAAAEDLGAMPSRVATTSLVADRYALLADDFRRIGDPSRGDAMARRAAEIDASPTPFGRGPGRPGPRDGAR